MKPALLLLALLLSPLSRADSAPPESDHAADEARLNIMRAIDAAKDQPFIEPDGDLKALLLKQTPSLAAPDCGVRYKQLAVEGKADTLVLLVAPQGRCRQEPGLPPMWVLQVGVDVRP